MLKKIGQLCLMTVAFCWITFLLRQITNDDTLQLEISKTPMRLPSLPPAESRLKQISQNEPQHVLQKVPVQVTQKTSIEPPLKATKNSPIASQDSILAQDSTPEISKVLFVTYSRSGSSFLGEILNRNKNAFYHFEPLLGVYSALYGIPFGMKSMAVFHYDNGTDRWPPELEYHTIAQNLIDLLSCDIDRLPVEMLQNKFSISYNKEEKFAAYKSCLQKAQVAPNQAKSGPKPKKKVVPTAEECKNNLKKECGTFFDNKREFRCFEKIYNKKYPFDREAILSHLDSLQSDFDNVPGDKVPKDNFTVHNTCMLKAKEESSLCIEHLKSQCFESTLRGAKLIRMRMETAGYILEKDPSIKIVHYFRDPRALELSRSVGMRGNKQQEMIDDAKITCHKMRQDIAARKRLEKQYPDNFMVLKYEDLAMDTTHTAEKIYQFLGATLPQEVLTWLENNTQANSGKKLGGLSTSTRNATATALRWKSELPKTTIAEMSKICEDILQELNFDI